MSGEMLVISFVREVNHVIMAATLDSRQMPANNTQTLRINCSSTRVMTSVIGAYFFSREPRHIGYNPVSLELSDMA